MEPDSCIQLVLAAARTGRIERGAIQAVRALERGKARLVVVAEDIDADLARAVAEAASLADAPLIYVPDKAELGRAAGLDTSAAAVAITQFGSQPIGALEADVVVSTARVNQVLPYVERIDHALKFRRHFVQPLIEGTKKATLRLGFRLPHGRVVPLVAADTDETFAQARIQELDWLRFGDVASRADILAAEWPTSFDAIWREMVAVYGQGFDQASEVTYYRFALEE